MPRAPFLRLVRACLAALLFLALPPCAARAGAQVPPSITVTFSPPSGTYGPGPLQVTIAWYAANGLNDDSRTVDFDGTVVVPFGYTRTDNQRATSVGTILVEPGGAHEVTARICDLAAACRSGAVQYAGSSPSAAVTAETPSVAVAGGTRAAIRYRVANTGSVETTFRMSAGCPAGFALCAPSDSAVTLGAGAARWVDVEFLAPASGGGTVQLTVAAGIAFTGSAAAAVVAAADPGYVGDAASLLRIQRDACVTIATGNGTASECGDLRVAHALPSVRVLNRDRTPVLIYNSGHARPYPVVAAQFAGPAGAAADSFTALLRVNGTLLPTQRWAGWGPQQTRRISVSFDATTYPTGLYDYTLTVVAKRAGGTRDTLPVSRSGRMIIVNRAASPFGAGWWLAGLERLELGGIPGDTLKLWVGGDGSARLYRGSPGGPWRADGYDRPDSLYRPVGGTGYVRTLPGGARVHFDGAGVHVRTENALGQATVFNWVPAGSPAERRLQSILLPSAPGHPEQLSYQFEYGTAGPGCAAATTGLTRVRAPAAAGGYSDTWLCGDNLRRVTRIRDASPDTTSVAFGYAAGNGWMTSRTDRMGVTQTLGYRRVRFYNAVQPVRAGVTATTWVIAVETHGVNGTASTSADSVRVVFDGPRTELCDCAWWHVDRYGAPVDVRNALPQVTTVRRGDGRWPGRVTETVAPNGFTTTAVYDSLGYLSSTTAWNPYDDGRSATTTFQWDTAAASPSRVISPEGVVSQTGYDGFRRREWQQVGPSTTRRVRYVYNAMTHPTAPGQLERIVYPDSTADRLEYGARGNLSATVSPLGARSEVESDRLGRVTVQRVAIDTVAGQLWFQDDSTRYDAAGRVQRVASFAPSLEGEGPVRAVVVNEYDREGRLTALSRTSVPDPNLAGTITTRWEYDLAGRRTVEIAPDSTPLNPLDNPRDSTFYDLAGNVERVRTRRFAEILATAGPVDPATAYIRMEYDHLDRMTKRIVPGVRVPGRTEGITRLRSGLPAPRYGVYPTYPADPANCSGYAAAADRDCDYVIAGDVEEFEYHPQTGALVRADNGDARVSRTYFAGGAVRTETQRIRTVADTAAGGNFTEHVYLLSFAYDRNGRRTALTHPSQLAPAAGVPTRYRYDPVTGALDGIVDPLGTAFAYTYTPLGETESLVRPGGIVERFGYDHDGRLARNWMQQGGTWLRDVGFTYDPRGKMLTSTDLYGDSESVAVAYSGLGHVVTSRTLTHGIDVATGRSGTYEDRSATFMDALANASEMTARSIFTSTDGAEESKTLSLGAFLYQNGTGRIVARSSSSQYEETRYDASGNIVFTTDRNLATDHTGLRADRASYFDASDRLRAVDTRRLTQASAGENSLDNASPYYTVFEEYRYDALGRRVWVRARRTCDNDNYVPTCSRSDLRRVVWDGDSELYEIQVPGYDHLTAAQLENDTVQVPDQGGGQGEQDLNLHYGRVLYTYGTALDKPLSVIRMRYADRKEGVYSAWPGPFAVIPHWNTRGQAQSGTFASGARTLCRTLSGAPRCVVIDWPQGWFPYQPARFIPENWHGTLIAEKRDASGLYYRRNRYYDPTTGRFTQEDPIGLAGGINVYGFADGDPVSFSDPYGLSASCPDRVKRDQKCDEEQQGDGRVAHHDRCEVAGILTNYVAALRTRPREFGSDIFPAEFDFKFGDTADDLYQVGSRWIRADQFGNYAAGYAGRRVGGRIGQLLVIARGLRYAMEKGSGEHWSDSASRPMINAGAARARLEENNDGLPNGMRGGLMGRARYVRALTSTLGCPQ